jgi:predicted transcriptional regulator
MNPRCEAIGKYVVPLFRSLVAKELISTYKLTQVEAAQRLGTTQAAISQYINSKRANKGMGQFGDVVPKIQVMANETAKRLANKEIRGDEVTADFCKLCSSLCCK